MFVYSQTALRQTAPAPKPEPKRRAKKPRPAPGPRVISPETAESNERFKEMFLRGDRVDDIRIAFGYRACCSVSARAKRLGLKLRTPAVRAGRIDAVERDARFLAAWMNAETSLREVMATVGFENAGSASRLAKRLGLPLRKWSAKDRRVIFVPRDTTGGSK